MLMLDRKFSMFDNGFLFGVKENKGSVKVAR